MCMQWRIQDFPDGGTYPQGGGANLLFGKIFLENCMKMKEIGPRGGGGALPWHPLRPANGMILALHNTITVNFASPNFNVVDNLTCTLNEFCCRSLIDTNLWWRSVWSLWCRFSRLCVRSLQPRYVHRKLTDVRVLGGFPGFLCLLLLFTGITTETNPTLRF